MSEKSAVYAGTFDPLTFGHLDVIKRAAKIFDSLIIGVASATGKKTLFDEFERVDLVKAAVTDIDNVHVEPFDGLLVDYVYSKNAGVLIRGLRAFSDFEYEFQMALTNRRLAPDLETLFLMPKQEYSFLSSTNIKMVASLGGNVSEFVPKNVEEALFLKFGLKKQLGNTL